MSLKAILNEMETNRPNADMDVLMGSPDTMIGRVGLQRAAKETIKRLKLEYTKALMASTVFIVVMGTARDSFTNIACNETFGCFQSDPEAFFKDIVSRINPTLFGREGTRNLFNLVTNILEDKMLELDINSYNMLQFNDRYNAASNKAEDFVPLVRNAIIDQVGSEIVGVNAIHSIVDEAIKKEHSASVTPVVLNTNDEKFALDLKKNLGRIGSKVFLVVAGKASKTFTSGTELLTVVKHVNEESVGEALTQIRSKVL
jgi:hypothetical protein